MNNKISTGMNYNITTGIATSQDFIDRAANFSEEASKILETLVT